MPTDSGVLTLCSHCVDDPTLIAVQPPTEKGLSQDGDYYDDDEESHSMFETIS